MDVAEDIYALFTAPFSISFGDCSGATRELLEIEIFHKLSFDIF